MNYEALDRQVGAFASRLTAAVGLSAAEATKLATLVAAEVRFLDTDSKAEVIAASPVSLRNRLDELRAFQRWTEIASDVRRNPAVVRAHVIAQNYVCFVYLSEACFRVLRRISKPESVTRRCCKYLTDNPMRAFRNAIAHSNWTYGEGFRSLVFWAKKGSDPEEPLSRFEVSQEELDFWQTLSRAVAYAAYTTLESFGTLKR